MDQHPLVALKPPATLPIDYLCVVQDQLDAAHAELAANLGVLETLLADRDLVDLIGWDLVSILAPLLPASHHLLELIFAAGNAKEIVLASSVVLHRLFRPDDEQDGAESSNGDDSRNDNVEENDRDGDDDDDDSNDGNDTDDMKQGQEERAAASAGLRRRRRQRPPQQAVQFAVLLRLLPQAIARLRVQYPSRFIAPILQSILRAFERALVRFDNVVMQFLVEAVSDFTDGITTDGRPLLPSRQAASVGHSSATDDYSTLACEFRYRRRASRVVAGRQTLNASRASDETRLHERVVQAFIVSLASKYIFALAEMSPAGLGWAGRAQELMLPHSVLPGFATQSGASNLRQELNRYFAADAHLVEQDNDVAALLSLVVERGPSPNELTLHACRAQPADPWDFEDDEPPRSEAAIPFAPAEAVTILAALQIYSLIAPSAFASEAISAFALAAARSGPASFSGEPSPSPPPIAPLSSPTSSVFDLIAIYPYHAAFVLACMGRQDQGQLPRAAPAEAIIVLGLVASNKNQFGHEVSEGIYKSYFTNLAQIAACSPSAQLRYLTHKLLTSILRARQDPRERLNMCIATLKETPFSNVRECAVGWFKDQTLSAAEGSLFANGEALREAAEHLFPNLASAWQGISEKAKMDDILENKGFYLASLNLYLAMTSSDRLRDSLGLAALAGGLTKGEAGIDTTFLAPLLSATNASITSCSSLEKTLQDRTASPTRNEAFNMDSALDRIQGMRLSLELVESVALDVAEQLK